MGETPADRSEQPLPQKKEAADVDHVADEQQDRQGNAGQRSDELDLVEDLADLGLEQPDVGLDQPRKRGLGPPELLKERRGHIVANAVSNVVGLLPLVSHLVQEARNRLPLIRAAVSKKP